MRSICSSERGCPFMGMRGARVPRRRWIRGLSSLLPATMAGPWMAPPLRRAVAVSTTSPLWWVWALWQARQFCSSSGLTWVSKSWEEAVWAGVPPAPPRSAAGAIWSIHLAIKAIWASGSGSPPTGIWGSSSPRRCRTRGLPALSPARIEGPDFSPPLSMASIDSMTSPLWGEAAVWQARHFSSRTGRTSLSKSTGDSPRIWPPARIAPPASWPLPAAPVDR